MKKPDDDDRYVSMIGEPIPDGNGKVWGILVISSSVASHFNKEDRRYAYAAQSLAGIIGLAIKVVASRQPNAASQS